MKYSLAPVLDYCAQHWPDVFDESENYSKMPKVRLCDILETSSPTAHRWVHAGEVSEEIADRIATKLGRHPAEFWPEWWDAAA